MNYCRPCRTDFASVAAFDRHRTGTHAYTLAEGLRGDPPHDDGRRCLDRDEMGDAGMELDSNGRWRIAADAESVNRRRAEGRLEATASPQDANVALRAA